MKDIKHVYYYLRDNNNKPIVTICLAKNQEGNIAKGFAICSDKDQCNKKSGKNIAFTRILKAFGKEKSSDSIKTMRCRNRILQLKNIIHIRYKSQYSPEYLTDFEKILLEQL